MSWILACATPPAEATDTGALPDPSTVPLAGECAMDADHGGFSVTTDDAATEIVGAVADGVVPASVLEPIAAEGECVVLRRNNPFCDPACNPGEACDFDGTCAPWPQNQDLGGLSVYGMVEPVTMEPVVPGNTYFATDLPFPAMEEGATLALVGDFALHGVAVEPLGSAPAWTVDAGVDLAVSWPAPAREVVRSDVVAEMALDQHGTTPSVVRCTFADTGAGVVPGAILAALFDAGITGFPSGSLKRRTADSVASGAGCMDLEVRTVRTATVDVVGHTPCVTTDDCPDGQTCDQELQTCR